MKNLVSISLTALLILSIMPTSLQASQIDTESIQVNPSFIGITSNNVNYIYSTVDLKKLHNEQSSLSEVSCQLSDFISNFDIDKKIDTLNIHTLGFKSQELDVSIDVRNCSFSANRTTERLSPKKGINDMEALEIVQNTINNMFVNNDGLFKFDKPVIQSRNDVFLSIDSPKEVNNKPEKRYNTISVFYPYVIGGTPVYTNYGTQLGATVITDEYGIVSVQTSSLPFRSTPKTSQKNTWYGLQKFIKRGGNQAYRGAKGKPVSVKFKKPERVSVYFQIYLPNNTIRSFVSDGIKLSSSLPLDKYNPQNYEMIFSDFAIGNNSSSILLSDSKYKTRKSQKLEIK